MDENCFPFFLYSVILQLEIIHWISFMYARLTINRKIHVIPGSLHFLTLTLISENTGKEERQKKSSGGGYIYLKLRLIINL